MSDSLNLSPEDFAKMMATSSPSVLDVRETKEVESDPFHGAIHMPLGHLSQNVASLDSHGLWVTLCAHGVRSLQAAIFLEHQGFKHVYNLKGGMSAWKQYQESRDAKKT